ncbi:hypothetical protein GCM10020331_095850 [Ectobacillus funiculus]
MASEIEQWSGGWDILLNAPGKKIVQRLFELEMEEWDDIMDVNLKRNCTHLSDFREEND